MARWVKQAIVAFWLGGLALYYLIGVIHALRTLLLMLFVSIFLSFAFEPAVNKLHKHGIKRGYGTALIFIVAVVGTMGMTAAVATALAEQITDLVDKLPGYIDDAESWINSTFNQSFEFDTLRDEFVDGGGVENLFTRFADDVVNAGATAVGVLFNLFTVALFTFYMVADGPKFRRTVLSILDDNQRAKAVEIWELAIEKTGGYIYSRTVLAVAAAVIHGVAFMLLDVPSPLALGIWVGVLSQFVPAVGTYLAGLLPGLIALLHEPRTALWVVIIVVGYQQLENFVLAPRVTAHTMDMHPALAFGSVIAGIALIGVVGALLALPVAAVVQGLLSSYTVHKNASHKNAANNA